MMKKIFLLAMIFAYCTQTMVAQTITEGSRWWNGERLYTAHVDGAGNITMDGESESMGSDTFILMKEGDGHYTLNAGNKQGWLFVRGKVGWRVDYVRQGRQDFLAVRNPHGDAVGIFVWTPEDLDGCLTHQKELEAKEVSWVLQHSLLDAHYLGCFSKPQLRLMRNEILARHGWRFQSKDLREHFGRQPWYKPVADNNRIKLNSIETINLQLLKYEESLDDRERVRYDRAEAAPEMAEAVDGVITVTTEEQFINVLGNNRTVQIGADVHLNLSRILEQEDKFAGVPGRAWATIVKKDISNKPIIVSESCNDGQQLTLKHFEGLTIRGERNSSIEVDPRYAFCLNFYDCFDCRVENLTIGHTEYGYCDGGVIGFEGGRNNIISDCDLYGCGTFGIVGRSLGNARVKRTKIHHCTYGIMDLYDCWNLTFEDCDFFSNKENPLISNGSSLNTTFRGCRIYDNWAEGELFSTNEPIRLFGCEIHHPRIGDIDSLVTDNHCLIDGMSPVMPPRTKPIGPDVD